MKKGSFRFLLILLLILLIVLAVHLFILNMKQMQLFENKILLSYLLNYVLAGLILAIVQSNLNKQSSYTGFIFMIGSGIKFLVFFIFFYPSYQQDTSMQTAEFAAFFTPYAVCLILEVIYLSKLLNNQTYSEDKLD